MKRKLPNRDPIAANQRDVIARRRVGENVRCACGESRPNALTKGRDPAICASCDREKNGRTTLDRHHVAGKSNSQVKIPIWVNDHLARLNVDQYDWPKKTLENPNGSPLLAAAASNRGFADTTSYLTETLLLERAEMLEALDVFLEERLGPEWWVGTPLEKYRLKR